MNPAPNLFFVGPMGAGKTTIGRRAAELLGVPFFDLDHAIEENCGADIPLIFELEGEDGFRRRETALLAEFAGRNGIALATGGGAVLAEANRRVLKQRGFVVYLETTIDDQLRRLARDRKRPLIATDDRQRRLLALAAERGPLYHEVADLTIPAGHGNSVPQVAQRLAVLLREQWQRSDTTSSDEEFAA